MTNTLSTPTSAPAAPAPRMGASAWGRIAICVVLALPAVVFRLGGFAPNPLVDLLVFGGAVVAASFLLAWAAEAAQKDIAGALAIAILALIAVLPEYAVDLYYAFRSGYDPSYEQFAAANMTGSNRLLLGFGWPLVVVISLLVARRFVRAGSMPPIATKVLELERSARLDVGFLALLAVVAFLIPLIGSIPMWFGFVLLAAFVWYLWRASKVSDGDDDEELPGMAGNIASMPQRARRWTIAALFVVAAAVILSSAEPFADALVQSGSALGIDSYFLVQWLAPLATEAPEFIVAALFALRGMGGAAIGTLIASKVNQWSLLVGSLPIAHVLGGGTTGGLPLDARQVEEFMLTASQTVLGVAIIIALRFHRWSAIALAALFAVQFFVTDTNGRWVLSIVHLVAAAVVFWVHRKDVLPTITAPFRRPSSPAFRD
ncbi:sodium/hydrogen exchanger [Curtobacterium pusillum]|uniref:Cation:H+ antiporter n=2 Tax=Curtobacterium pusillum TaxID=69373 RepID=A0AAW3T5B5_9MICO|nr:sodium:proton exchanger [Curtobacterium pusillum]MBA8989768.1 cation:H+ antiporter [Curtobacterium pusillum]GLK32013.1 sodium/calcium exchanger family protein [Curtobacterium pusillum]